MFARLPAWAVESGGCFDIYARVLKAMAFRYDAFPSKGNIRFGSQCRLRSPAANDHALSENSATVRCDAPIVKGGNVRFDSQRVLRS